MRGRRWWRGRRRRGVEGGLRLFAVVGPEFPEVGTLGGGGGGAEGRWAMDMSVRRTWGAEGWVNATGGWLLSPHPSPLPEGHLFWFCVTGAGRGRDALGARGMWWCLRGRWSTDMSVLLKISLSPLIYLYI